MSTVRRQDAAVGQPQPVVAVHVLRVSAWRMYKNVVSREVSRIN
jgi:hypothetical protein